MVFVLPLLFASVLAMNGNYIIISIFFIMSYGFLFSSVEGVSLSFYVKNGFIDLFVVAGYCI